MSFLSDFDTAAHAAFADAGMEAFAGTYTPPGEDPDTVPCRVFVEHDLQTVGEFGQAATPRTQVSLLRADVAAPVPGATVVAGGVTYLLDAIVSRDPSLTAWLATHA